MTATESPPAERRERLDPTQVAVGVARRAAVGGAVSSIAVPVAAVLAALALGAVLIVAEGENPLAVYGEVLRGVFSAPRGFSDTATAATPLVLIGLGYAIAYRARVFTIGGEGQYLIGATAGAGWVSAGGVSSLPGPILIVSGVVVAVVAGGLWGALAGWLGVRFGASIVVSSLMLAYVAEAVHQWAVRVGVRDDESFIPAGKPFGDAVLPGLPGTETHIGFLVAVVLVPVAAVWLARHRSGFHVDALGHNPEALDANETRSRWVILLVVTLAGALAGLAGLVETAGVNGRLGAEAGVGFGWEAIIVALLGRLHPVGVLVAGLAITGMTIGFEVSQRTYDLPSSLIGVISALVVVFVVVGDALATRGSGTR